MRAKTGISILHGDNMELAEKVRRHQNFVEYVPIALILIGFLELNGSNAIFLHVLGASLVVVRVAHAKGLYHDNIRHPHFARLARQELFSSPWLQASRRSGKVSTPCLCRDENEK